MTTQTSSAFATVEQLNQNYGMRARELHAQGKKVIGYLCALTPVDIIAAAGFIPMRVKGSVNEPITKADTQMETIVCPVVRSCYDLTVKGSYDYLSGVIIPHACDSINRTYDIWKNTLDLPYTHMINMPHATDASSLAFYKEILKTFRKSLGKFAGKEISDAALAQSIQEYNQLRLKVRDLYEFRKSSPPLISGAEVTKVLVAAMSIPVMEAVTLIDSIIAEVKTRQAATGNRTPRIMVVGADIDDASFINLVETSGASVVVDDLCPGTREYWEIVEVTADPVDGLADRYLNGVKCGRTYREQKGTYAEHLQDRYCHIGNFVKDFKVDGVILFIYKYCDSFGFEVPAMKDYVKTLNKPVLYLEDEYSQASMARLKTRIQAFLEILGS